MKRAFKKKIMASLNLPQKISEPISKDAGFDLEENTEEKQLKVKRKKSDDSHHSSEKKSQNETE